METSVSPGQLYRLGWELFAQDSETPKSHPEKGPNC